MQNKIKFIYDGNYTRHTFQNIEKYGKKVNVRKLEARVIRYIEEKEGVTIITPSLSDPSMLYIGNSNLPDYQRFRSDYMDYFAYRESPIVNGKEKRVDTEVVSAIWSAAADHDIIVLFSGDGDFANPIRDVCSHYSKLKVYLICSKNNPANEVLHQAVGQGHRMTLKDTANELKDPNVACEYYEEKKEPLEIVRIQRVILRLSSNEEFVLQSDVIKKVKMPKYEFINIIKQRRDCFVCKNINGTWYIKNTSRK